MIVSTYSLKNRSTVGVLVLLISLAGAFCYMTLPRESVPDVPIPLVLVMTPYQGVSPADIESSITQKIEKKLTGVKGVKEVRSTSAEGLSMVQVEFEPSVRIEDALQSVRDKVDQAKGDLPSDAQSPVVREINIAEFPILYMNISGPLSPVTLKDIGDRLKDAIEQNVPGVLSVSVLGGLEPEIRIEVDADRVAFYGLTIPEVMSLVPSEHVNISAGGLSTPGTKFNVRIPAEFKEARDITHIPIANRNGRQIYLQDVARVTDTFKDRETVSRLDGETSLTIAVQKRVGANIINIVEGVKAVVAEAQPRVPQAVRFTYTMDRSDDIKEMVAELENHIITALVLVILVMLVAIGVRASLVAALAVPLSLFMTFAVLELMGLTLNMVVLFSLILSVGMLVDDAVVIVENIYRHMQMGKSRFRAAREACEEVAWPVITSTMTICAAFFPMVFWPGIMGSFFKYIPITIIIALLSSLFVALVVSPVVCTVIPGQADDNHGNGPFLRGYRRFLRFAIGHRVTALILCGILLVGMAILYGKKGHGVEFFPDLDPKNAKLNIRGPQGTTLAQTDEIAVDLERRLMPRLITPDHPDGEVRHIVTNLGAATSGDGASVLFGGGVGGPHEGNITLVFPEFEHRRRSSSATVAEIRSELTDIAGAEIKLEKEAMGPPTGAAVTVRLVGEDLRELQKLNDQARAMIRNVPGLVNLRSDMELTRPELVFRVDRDRARMAGVDTATIGNFLKTSIFGTKVGTYHYYNDEYDITVRLPEGQRTNIPDILRLRVPNRYGAAVPLSTVGSFDYSGGLGTIKRVDQNRVVTLTGDAEGRLGPAVLADVQEILSPQGRNRVIESDVLDWPAFLTVLRGESELAKRIVAHIAKSKDGPAATAVLVSGATPTAKQQAALLRTLNEALAVPELVDAPLAERMALGAEVAELLTAAKPGFFSPPNVKQNYTQQVLRRNRVALEHVAGPALAPAVKLDMPMNYKVVYAGQDEEMQKAISFLLKAGVVSAVLIVLIMVAQFNTLSVPFVIMVTVVFSWIGVLLGLLVTGIPFGVMMTGIGVLSLTGIVVRNGIVLMDYTRQLQRQGLDVVDACVEAGAIRLRPVLLVAACTSLGLVPIALGWSFDFHSFRMIWESEASEWWKGMAVAVIYGLTFATVLTLVVVPCLYVIIFRLAAKLGLGGLKKSGEDEADCTSRVA